MTETLICDYTRRGFISGLILRFPTICVRPGKPTAAASSFLSGMIREPLNGLRCEIPLEDRSFRSMLCSPRNLVANLLHGLYNVRDDALPSHIRQVNLPGICVSIQEMMEALATVAGKDKLSLLSEKHDESLAAILRSWATEMDFSKALKLGFKADESFEEAVRDYARDVGFVNQD